MPRATNRVLGQTRQQELLQYLRRHRSGHIAELAEVLDASESTIRRDLDQLQEQGLVERVHGGAAVTEEAGEPEPPLRAVAHAEEKRRIGERAASLVEDTSTILISGGTTTEAMLGFLAGRPQLTVVTNSLNVASILAKHHDGDIVVLGGVLRKNEMSLLGHVTVQALQDFQIDTVFSGAYGIDPELGLTGMNVGETQTDRALIGSSARLVVLADSSKLNQRGAVRLAPAESISTLVIDDGVPDEAIRTLQEKGVDVVVC